MGVHTSSVSVTTVSSLMSGSPSTSVSTCGALFLSAPLVSSILPQKNKKKAEKGRFPTPPHPSTDPPHPAPIFLPPLPNQRRSNFNRQLKTPRRNFHTHHPVSDYPPTLLSSPFASFPYAAAANSCLPPSSYSKLSLSNSRPHRHCKQPPLLQS